MFSASMITYDVNESTGTVIAKVSGVKYDAIESMLKAFRRENLILSNDSEITKTDKHGMLVEISTKLTNYGPYMLPNEFTAKAVHDPNDPHPFSIERGKQIARRRLYNKYNIAFANALKHVMDGVTYSMQDVIDTIMLSDRRMIAFDYFEDYEVLRKHEAKSVKQ